MSECLTIGVMGCASIATRSIIPAIKDSENFLLYGVASRSSEKAKNVAELFDCSGFDSYQALIDSDVDAIYVPLPNSMHFEWVKKSLAAGKHVLVEKSMATNLRDCVELNDLAESNNLALLENFQFRFHTQFGLIKEFLHSDEFGDLRLMRASFGFPPFSSSDNIRYAASLGGGALLDAGAYPLKVSQLILGVGLHLDSSFLKFCNENQVDLWGSGTLVSRSEGVQSQFSFGFDHCYQNTLELWGSRGHLLAKRIFTAGPDVNPEVQMTTSHGVKNVTLEADNHFINMLSYFNDFCQDPRRLAHEYVLNKDQARLIGAFNGR